MLRSLLSEPCVLNAAVRTHAHPWMRISTILCQLQQRFLPVSHLCFCFLHHLSGCNCAVVSAANENMSASRSSLVEQMVEQQPWAADPTYQEGAILFCCKSNISYDEAELGGASDTAFSFSTGDYLQVVKIIDSDWWLARVFGGGATLGRMPAYVYPSGSALLTRAMSLPGPPSYVCFHKRDINLPLPPRKKII